MDSSSFASAALWGTALLVFTGPDEVDLAPIGTGQGLCEQARPKGFVIHTGCFNERTDLILQEAASWGAGQGRADSNTPVAGHNAIVWMW